MPIVNKTQDITDNQEWMLQFINNKMDFVKNSNFNRSMIDNVVYVHIDFSKYETDKQKEVLDIINKIVLETNPVPETQSKSMEHIDNFILWNGIAFKTPQVDTEYETHFIGNDRRYSFLRNKDTNVEVSFLENSTISLKRIFRRLRDLLLPDSRYYYLDVAIPEMSLYHINFEEDTVKRTPKLVRETFYNCMPTTIEGHMMDNRNGQSQKLTDVTMVYKKYQIEEF